MKLFKNKTFLLLSLIFLFALIIRIVLLGQYPSGFHIDEASLGYNGYSMLLTGKDEAGKTLPLYIDMFGDFRPSGYHYLTIPTIAVFGLTEFATRLPGAIFGALSVFAIYFLSYSLFKNKNISLVSALLLAITPWHFVLSRASAEAIVALFFIMTGFAFIILSFQNKKFLYFTTGALISSISFFFYHTPRVFVPMLLLALVIFTFNIWKNYSRKYKVNLVLFFLIISLVAVFLVFGISGGTGRFSQVNILKSFETNFQLQQTLIQDSLGHAPRILSRSIHNKVTNISYMFVSNYFDYFSGSFLFTKGGYPHWYSIPKVGILYLFELPFLIFGAFYLIRKKDLYSRIPFVWLLLGPVVAAITLDDIPNINRASVMFPILEIICAFGIVNSVNYIPKKLIKISVSAFILVVGLSFYYFMFQYFINATYFNPWYRNNGFSKMMEIVRKNYNTTDAILMSKSQGGIYPLVLFYLKYDPSTYQKEGSPKSMDYKTLGKIMFVPQDCPFNNYDKRFSKGKKRIFIEDGNCPPSKPLENNIYKYEYVLREDGTKAFRIVYAY